MAERVLVDTAFEGGHGSHWDAVLEDPGELGRVVAEAYKRGISEPPQRSAPDLGMSEVTFRALRLGHADFEARVIELALEGKSKPAVATVYPHLKAAGPVVACRTLRVIEWGHGALEAQVGIEIAGGGGGLAFFASDYFSKRQAYRSGEVERIVLTAIAYTCGTISQKERLEAFAGGHVDVSRSTLVAPLKDSERAPYYDDDFFLQGPLTSCEPFAYPPWGEGAVLTLDLEGVGALPMFARKKDFPHGWPRKGEYVAAYAWIQGRAAPQAGPVR